VVRIASLYLPIRFSIFLADICAAFARVGFVNRRLFDYSYSEGNADGPSIDSGGSGSWSTDCGKKCVSSFFLNIE
jgi:hypothetical protein